MGGIRSVELFVGVRMVGISEISVVGVVGFGGLGVRGWVLVNRMVVVENLKLGFGDGGLGGRGAGFGVWGRWRASPRLGVGIVGGRALGCRWPSPVEGGGDWVEARWRGG